MRELFSCKKERKLLFSYDRLIRSISDLNMHDLILKKIIYLKNI